MLIVAILHIASYIATHKSLIASTSSNYKVFVKDIEFIMMLTFKLDWGHVMWGPRTWLMMRLKHSKGHISADDILNNIT